MHLLKLLGDKLLIIFFVKKILFWKIGKTYFNQSVIHCLVQLLPNFLVILQHNRDKTISLTLNFSANSKHAILELASTISLKSLLMSFGLLERASSIKLNFPQKSFLNHLYAVQSFTYYLQYHLHIAAKFVCIKSKRNA